MRALQSVMAFGLSTVLPSQGLPLVTGTTLSPGVIALEPEDMASIFGGQQTQTGKATTAENVQEYLDGMLVAAAVNEGALGGGALAVGAVAVGTWGAVLGAYGITQQIFNDLVDPLAADIYTVISSGQSGRLTTTQWSLSDLAYRSDLVISIEATGWISDYYCRTLGCFCDNGSGCDDNLACVDGYCGYNS